MAETRKRLNLKTVSVAEPNDSGPDDVIEETIVRFSNPRPPQKASQNATNLAAVCCPAFSLD